MRARCDAKIRKVWFLAVVEVDILRADASSLTMTTNTLRLVASQDADGAAERGQLDFGEAAANGAKQALGVL